MSSKRELSPASFSQDNSSFGDMDAFLDFGDGNNFMTPSAIAAATSPSSSPTPPVLETPLEFSAPSHPYSLHVQQTDVFGVEFGDVFDTSTYMQLDNKEPESSTSQNPSSVPSFFYTERPGTTEGNPLTRNISPLVTIEDITASTSSAANSKSSSRQPSVSFARSSLSRPPQQARMNYYPGYSNQNISCGYDESSTVLQNQVKSRQQQGVQHNLKTQAPLHPQEQKIQAILNSFKAPLASNAISKTHSELLPHIARMKKEEEEMDDDERLLASEEGKKLSSKERRQLRNKVSARAFRSRRKEYISQLEAEVAKKAHEAETARDINKRLEEENSRLRSFTEMLMKHSAFQEFLNDMTIPLTNPPTVSQQQVQQQQQQQQQQLQQQVQQPQQLHVGPTFNPARDQNPHVSPEEQWPLSYSNWNPTPHVFRAEVPEEPVLTELDGKMGNGEDFMVADGFFANIRDEKGNIDKSRMYEKYDEHYDEDEDIYQPPENIDELYAEEQNIDGKRDLDKLFPGVGVNSLLERLELIAAGESRVDDLFDIGEPEKFKALSHVENIEPYTLLENDHMERPTVCTSNRMLRAAEGVYRRIGMTVGGNG